MTRAQWVLDPANTGHLPLTSRLVLGALAVNVDTNGPDRPLPTTATLVAQTGLTASAVRYRVNNLRGSGALAAMLYPVQ